MRIVLLFPALLVFCFLTSPAPAHLPPTPEQIAELQATGKLEQARRFEETLGNHQFREGLAASAQYKMKVAGMKAQGYSEGEIAEMLPQPAVPPALKNMPTTGTPKTVTLLVDFADYRAATEHPTVSVSKIQYNIYGGGTAHALLNEKPYDSVNAYWKRASQGQLDIKGEVLGWVNLAGNRSTWEPDLTNLTEKEAKLARNQGFFDVIKAAMQALDAAEDFAQYDNDNDGYIDAVNVLWTGPTGAWLSFWWGQQWQVYVDDAATTTFDGKKLRVFSWQKMETRNNNTDFNPTTLIHETGHLLGLPDLYDYKPETGFRGGVGGFDIMDGNQGNPNGFFRWMMGWITPTIVSAGVPVQRTLNASGNSSATGNQAVVIFPGASASEFQEFFLIENRHRTGNDGGRSALPSDGLAIWHVDSTLTADGMDFANSNTDSPAVTPHKLVRLVQADGEGAIELFAAGVDAGDYWNQGEVFGPATTPDSNRYSGAASNVTVSNISADGLSMTANIGFSTAVQAPDLTDSGTNFHSLTPTSRIPGEVFNVTGRVTNFGNNTAAPFTVSYYLSTNSTITGTDVLLGTRVINSTTAAAETVNVDKLLAVPAGTGPGVYFVGWRIDSANAVAESQEGNNTVTLAAQLTVNAPPVAEIRVDGPGQELTDGDTTPTTEKGTQFGTVDLNVETTRTFTIRNTGNAALTFGNPAVTLTGADAAHFRIAAAPASTALAAGSSRTFVLGFRPTSAGAKSVIANIHNSDADESVFDFILTGTGLVADDHGNTSGLATTAVPGSTVPGVINTPGDPDYFRLVVSEAGTLRTFTTGSLDTHGTLYNNSGTELDSNDDGGGADGTNFRIERLVTPGTYFVKVRAYNANATGAYAFVSQFVSTIVDDYGNTPAAAFSIGLQSATNGRLEAGGDLDVFRLTVATTGVLTLGSTGQTDVYGTLRDSTDRVFAEDDDGGNDRNFSLSAIVPAGTYYLTVRGFGAGTTGAYTVQSSFGTYIPPDDHANLPADGTVLALNGGADGVLDYFVDDDYFKITIPSAGTLTVYSTGSRDTLGNLGTVSTILVSSDDEGALTNFGYSFPVTAQTYFIRVKAYSPTLLGSYRLETSFRATGTDDSSGFPNESASVLTMAGNSGTRTATLEAGGDVDFFRIVLATDGLLTVDTAGTTDTFGTLRTEDGSVDFTDDDTGDGSNFRIPRYLAAGTYFVEVRGYDRLSTQGAYTLGWTLVPGPPEDDFGNTTDTATTTTWPGSRPGNLNYTGDEDLFRIVLAQPASLRIFTTGLTDTYGRLLATGGSVLASDDDSGDGNNFSLVATLAAGTYFVKTSGYTTGITGPYTLHVEVLPPFAITAMVSTGGTGMNITWVSDPGATYRIESATALTGPWQTVLNNLPGSHTGSSTTALALTPGETRRFYRVARNP